MDASAVPRPLPDPPQVQFHQTAFLPLALLFFGVGAWLAINLDTKAGLIGAGFAGVAAVAFLSKHLWSLVPKTAVADLLQRVTDLLSSRGTTIVIWCVFGLFVVLSWTIATVHLDADDRVPTTTVSRVEAGLSDKADGRVVASQMLHAGDHLISFLFVPPVGRTVWMTSQGLQTDARRVIPWSRTSFKYPVHFDSLITVSLLPTGLVLQALARDTAGVRLVVRENTPGGLVVADTVLKSAKGLLLASGPVAAPDSAALQRRWSAMVRARFGIDTGAASQLAASWWPPQPMRALRRLRVGEQLRFELSDAARTTARSDTFTVRSASSDAILP